MTPAADADAEADAEIPATAVIVGTGLMAPGIAAAVATSGATVAIAGRRAEAARSAAERAGALSGTQISAVGLDERGLSGATLVLETIAEDATAKAELLGQLESWLPQSAIIASNTSSLSLAALSDALAVPSRFAGLHFLNPANLTALVELTPAPATAPATVALLRRLVLAMGKRAIVLRHEVHGFVWNRLQAALLREALWLLAADVCDADDIDAAVSHGLAPRWVAAGPLATADLGGLETFSRICDQLFPLLAADQAAPAEIRSRAQSGSSLRDWTPEQRSSVETAREQALAFARGLHSGES